jgi:hypothetical protein
MLAAVFKRRGVLEIEDRPQPKGLAADEVLLEVEGCGVCGSDLHILSDPPGHPATEGGEPDVSGARSVALAIDLGRWRSPSRDASANPVGSALGIASR